MSNKWNEDETLKFVQLYREHECLWDKRCDAYKNKQMRASALEVLRDGMNKGLTINDIKAKIKSLRNTYYLELDKIEKSTRSGAGGNVYKPKAIWFEEYDSFVKPVTVRRKTTNNTEVSTDNENGVENDSQETEETQQQRQHETRQETQQEPRQETQQETRQDTLQETQQETPQFTPPIKKAKRSKLSQLSDMIKDLRNINDDNANTSICSEETDLDLFGKSVSAQMKTLSEVQAVIAKEKIQSILTQCRLTDLQAKNAHSYGNLQSQNMSSTHWNPRQVFTSFPVSQTCLPPAQSPTDTSSSSTSFQYSDNTTIFSPVTPYSNDSQDENEQDLIQFAFNNA
ncbi:uncharacterized protein LOC125230463 [Leguminivora glycinivorella]|uniref:uncharacterized protein LOC125230463 n=1 Tax=Leguminivora glycinivorella TaxID=1035111 RepID=UPI00201020FD|nr:uncharacterized protein LOC125230463 [Leguminivora glycinivorella]